MQNVFKEDSAKSDIPTNPGQQYYLQKYEKAWLGKRSASRNLSPANRGRKRAKTNMELCLESYPLLERYSKSRPDLSKVASRNMGSVSLKAAVKGAGYKVKEPAPAEEPVAPANEYGEEDELIQLEQIQETQDLANFDFVARKKNRREFLLNFFKQQSHPEPTGLTDDDDDQSVRPTECKPSSEEIQSTGKKIGEMFSAFCYQMQHGGGGRGFRANDKGFGGGRQSASGYSNEHTEESGYTAGQPEYVYMQQRYRGQ